MSTNTRITNEKGQVIGYKMGNGTYTNVGGKVIANVKNGSTYTAEGKVIGKGDQGLRLF